MNKFAGGQRLLTSILTIILLVLGAILGSAGFPDIDIGTPPAITETPEGTESPEVTSAAPIEVQVIESQAAFQAETVISPDYLKDVGGKAVVPFLLAITLLIGLFRALSARINNPSDPFQASDLTSLLKSKEFWINIVGAVVAAGQMAGVQLLDEGSQAIIVSGILSIMNGLMWSYGSRPSGVTQESSKLEVEVVTPIASQAVSKD